MTYSDHGSEPVPRGRDRLRPVLGASRLNEPTTPRPRAQILLRVDRDCWPAQWRLDCGRCGLVIGRAIPGDSIGDQAIAATLGHVCSPTVILAATAP